MKKAGPLPSWRLEHSGILRTESSGALAIDKGRPMPHNLFVSYDLNAPGQHYEKVATAIKQLGPWAKVQKSLWFVDSTFEAQQARDHIWKSMDASDSLIVIDASTNEAAWFNVSPAAAQQIQTRWYMLAA